jgi:adenine-specific DNA glycosylase
MDYPDNGCEYSPRCTQCPLRQCRYDDPHGRKRQERAQRKKRAKGMRQRGYTVTQIANRLEVSERTAHRLLK